MALRSPLGVRLLSKLVKLHNRIGDCGRRQASAQSDPCSVWQYRQTSAQGWVSLLPSGPEKVCAFSVTVAHAASSSCARVTVGVRFDLKGNCAQASERKRLDCGLEWPRSFQSSVVQHMESVSCEREIRQRRRRALA